MNNSLMFFEEPKLLFGYGQSATDPRDGLSLFSPFEQFPKSYSIQAGVIGTPSGIKLYQNFVSTLQRPILSDTKQRPSFLGFEAIFGVAWSEIPAISVSIPDKDISDILAEVNVNIRTYKLVTLFIDELKRIKREEETRVDIWFIIVPREVSLLCRPLSNSKEGEKLTKKAKSEASDYVKGKRPLFTEIEEELIETTSYLDAKADFHDQLKARLIQEGVDIPVQIMLEPKLEFKDPIRMKAYKDRMSAHLAWTISTTVYYKLGKLPWKLNEIRDGVCYVGLVFKKYSLLSQKGYACSAAQMFLDSGDGNVFRGNVGPWQSLSDYDFHLDAPSSQDLIEKALRTYLRRNGTYPSELFIHGQARFTDDEWAGFHAAVQALNAPTKLVGIVIKRTDKLKLFRDIEQDICKYGNLRGLGIVIDNWEGYIWTNGFVPRLGTSLSKEIPNPLRVQIVKGKADIEQVLRDVLALTKLNYNACKYGDGLPVTLRFSDEIGNILTAIPNMDVETLQFKFYI